MLDRQKIIYGRYPRKAAFDGGFSFQKNLKKAKEREGRDKEYLFFERPWSECQGHEPQQLDVHQLVIHHGVDNWIR